MPARSLLRAGTITSESNHRAILDFHSLPTGTSCGSTIPTILILGAGCRPTRQNTTLDPPLPPTATKGTTSPEVYLPPRHTSPSDRTLTSTCPVCPITAMCEAVQLGTRMYSPGKIDRFMGTHDPTLDHSTVNRRSILERRVTRSSEGLSLRPRGHTIIVRRATPFPPPAPPSPRCHRPNNALRATRSPPPYPQQRDPHPISRPDCRRMPLRRWIWARRVSRRLSWRAR